MALLLKELLELEVEPLEVSVSEPEILQDSSLDTLTTASDRIEAAALLTGKMPIYGPRCACGCCFCVCC